MKIVLFGTTDLTRSVAEFLFTNSYEIVAIVTIVEVFSISYKADGVKNTRFVDMEAWGKGRNIPVIMYNNTDQVISELKELKVTMDFGIVVGWYHMVPKKLRDLFSLGCGGFHASLLPRLRGGAPLNWAILLGLNETGVSFFELADGVDDGLLYAQEKFAIKTQDYIADLIKKSEKAILKMLCKIVPQIEKGQHLKYQQEGRASYCGQRAPEDSQIHWNDSAEKILCLIRASSLPYPGAYSFFEGEKVIIWKAKVAKIDVYGATGQIIIIDGDVCVVCGEGALILQTFTNNQLFKKANNKRMN